MAHCFFLKIRLYSFLSYFNNTKTWGSGCGSVGKAVASNTRGPLFESSHRQNFISNVFSQLH